MPVIGASQYSQCARQIPPARAGPNDLAGFMLAPVNGPPIRAQKPTVSPTASAAIPSATRSSVATAMITNIKANERSRDLAPRRVAGAGEQHPKDLSRVLHGPSSAVWLRH